MHISKAQIKLVRSLQQKKFRDSLHYFVAEGDKCIGELKKDFELVLLANSDNATTAEIAQMSAMRAPQGSIAVFKQRPAADTLPPVSDLILCLDGVQDPGNLGTIIRTADWFGVKDIVCSQDTADCYNPKVVQATMGALARVHVHYVDLVTWLSNQQSVKIYGTLLEGKNIYEVLQSTTYNQQPCIVHRPSSIIIVGNEGKGISQPVRGLITDPVRIPSYPEGVETSESLNVAIATAVTLATFRHLQNSNFQ